MSSPHLVRIHRDGEEYGPFEPRQVVELITAGNLVATDFAWYQGLEDWQALGSTPEFQSVFATPPSEPSTDPTTAASSGSALRLVKHSQLSSPREDASSEDTLAEPDAEFDDHRAVGLSSGGAEPRGEPFGVRRFIRTIFVLAIAVFFLFKGGRFLMANEWSWSLVNPDYMSQVGESQMFIENTSIGAVLYMLIGSFMICACVFWGGPGPIEFGRGRRLKGG